MTTALEGGEGSASRPGRSLPWERAGTHCTGGWVGPRTGLNRCGNLAPAGIRSPDRPARSQSLYRLRYAAHSVTVCWLIIAGHLRETFHRQNIAGRDPLLLCMQNINSVIICKYRVSSNFNRPSLQKPA